MSLTCVSGYFPAKNKHDNKYVEWFKNTLSINCPYVFFTNKETVKLIENIRKDLPTYYIVCNIEDFYTYKYKDKMITHELHCPSVELNLIWNEKIFMVQQACKINPFNSEWFHWIDAGICVYRDVKPSNEKFWEINKLNDLPKDQFIYSSSNPYDKGLVRRNKYYHHISGTTYLLHKNIVNDFANVYKRYLDKLIDKNNIWTDQVILTHIYKDSPNAFHKLCDGYGEIAKYLFM